jgi:hypothetical protein
LKLKPKMESEGCLFLVLWFQTKMGSILNKIVDLSTQGVYRI